MEIKGEFMTETSSNYLQNYCEKDMDELSYKITTENEHPVMKFVRNLPFESILYPAILYLAFTDDKSVKNASNDSTNSSLDSGNQEINQENLENIENTENTIIQETNTIFKSTTGKLPPTLDQARFIEWCMPASDLTRPLRKGCGYVKSSDNSIVYTSCPTDYEHHIKAKRHHCWSPRCPICCNDTALKSGIKIEKQLLKSN